MVLPAYAGAVDASGSESSAHYRRTQRIELDLAQLMAPDFDLDHHCVQPR
jgi:hypothetical protein